jgi:predicted pyridoxine 5'-phosphate oxidase superfamily flavin-nucleotide-binding protein
VTSRPSSDVAFSDAVKQVQQERGSRDTYARIGRERGGFPTGVDDDLRAFLADIDTAYLASASADGQPYVQHRGGPRGFLRALDDKTIGFVDLTGNKQYISTGNLRENPRVCLFLMDYLEKRRVKVWGTARVVALADAPAALLQALAVGDEGKPEQVVLIDVDAWDINCSQHIPQKVNAADVGPIIERLQARIAELEGALEKKR